jgi:hypothetical protein
LVRGFVSSPDPQYTTVAASDDVVATMRAAQIAATPVDAPLRPDF